MQSSNSSNSKVEASKCNSAEGEHASSSLSSNSSNNKVEASKFKSAEGDHPSSSKHKSSLKHLTKLRMPSTSSLMRRKSKK